MQPGRIHPDSIQLNMPIHSRNVICIRFDLINNALTNVQKRSSVYFHFRYIPFDCIGKQAIILNNLLLDFFVLFSCEWFMKRIAFFAFVFWVTLLVSDISNHLVFSRYKCQILVLTYQQKLGLNIKSFRIKSTFISVFILNGVKILLLKCFINCRKFSISLSFILPFSLTHLHVKTYFQKLHRVSCGFRVLFPF